MPRRLRKRGITVGIAVLARAEVFKGYLDSQWAPLEGSDSAFSWPDVSTKIVANIRLIRLRLGGRRDKQAS